MKSTECVRWSWRWLEAYTVLILIIVTKVIINETATTWHGWRVNPADPQYDQKLRSDLIPSWANTLLVLLGPAVLMPLVLLATTLWYRRPPTWTVVLLDVHNAWLGLLASWATSGLVVASAKRALGQPRPSFNAEPVSEARRSFPSGHASSAAAGFVFLAWYVAGHWNVVQASRPVSWLKMAVLGILLFVPLIVAATRVRDYSHFPVDIVAGLLVGSVVATCTYRSVFRWPGDKLAWQPLCY